MSAIENVPEKIEAFKQSFNLSESLKNDTQEGESPLEALPENKEPGSKKDKRQTKGLAFTYLDRADKTDLQSLIFQYGASAKALYYDLSQRIIDQHGYYFVLNDKAKKRVCAYLKIENGLFDEILDEFFDSELFDRKLFDEHGILTNEDAQLHYEWVCKTNHRRNCEIDEKYKLIP